jgi:hypothetical protein
LLPLITTARFVHAGACVLIDARDENMELEEATGSAGSAGSATSAAASLPQREA